MLSSKKKMSEKLQRAVCCYPHRSPRPSNIKLFFKSEIVKFLKNQAVSSVKAASSQIPIKIKKINDHWSPWHLASLSLWSRNSEFNLFPVLVCESQFILILVRTPVIKPPLQFNIEAGVKLSLFLFSEYKSWNSLSSPLFLCWQFVKNLKFWQFIINCV